MKETLSKLGFFIWGLATLFYLFEFSLQVFQGTLANEILKDLHLEAEQFAFMGSAFYFAYAVMQPNVGILSDRFGVRRSLLFAVALCSLGAFLLSTAEGFYSALLARLFIGFGSSFSFVSILILSLNWFPKRSFGFFVGLAQFLGALGPLLAGAPLSWLVQKLHGDWRLVVLGMSFFGWGLFLVMLAFLQDKPKNKKQKIIFLTPHFSLSKKIQLLKKTKQAWWIFAYASCIYVSLPLLSAYWGTSYLQTKDFSRSEAAFIVSMVWLGMASFCPLLGIFSDRIERRKVFLIASAALGIFSSALILYAPITQRLLLLLLFFLLGAAGAGQSLTFALVAENVPKKLQPLTLGLNNFFIIIFVAALPPLVTYLIQLSARNHPGHFTQSNFADGFIVIPILYLIALLVSSLGIKETFCRQQGEVHTLSKRA